MMNDSDFTAAMERAVAKRGKDWRYPRDDDSDQFYRDGVPTYSTPEGAPTCLVGAAMYEAGMTVPKYYQGGSAVGVLINQVTTAVMLAARAAQIHQDRRKPWGEALEVYHTALGLAYETNMNELLTPYHGTIFYNEALKRLGFSDQPILNVIDQAHASMSAAATTFKKVSVSVVDAAEAFSELTEKVEEETLTPTPPPSWSTLVNQPVFHLPSITLSFDAPVSQQVFGLMTGTNAATSVLHKKDHALIA